MLPWRGIQKLISAGTAAPLIAIWQHQTGDDFYFVSIIRNCHRGRPQKLFRNFERPFTSRTKLRSTSNFAKRRYEQFSTFRFSTSKSFFEVSNNRLLPKDGSVRPQTLGKRVSDDPRHFIFRRRNFFFRQIFSSKKCS